MTSPTLHKMALTDDEAVAVAIQHKKPWPSPLPTLEQATSDQLEAAGNRGWRSLVARKMSMNEGFDEQQLNEFLSPVFVHRQRIATFVTMSLEALTPSPNNMMTTFYDQDTGRCLAETTAPIGLHIVQGRPFEDCMSTLRSGAQSFYANGSQAQSEDVPPPVALCVSVAQGDAERLLVIGQGQLAAFSVAADRELTPSELPSAELTQGLAWVCAHRDQLTTK